MKSPGRKNSLWLCEFFQLSIIADKKFQNRNLHKLNATVIGILQIFSVPTFEIMHQSQIFSPGYIAPKL
jgi:hypothetical protein